MLPFTLPTPAHATDTPEWIGNGFRLGQQIICVLEYSENFAGWTDALTALHEEAAGESHPIDIASREGALHQLLNSLKMKNPCILEIGCSSGFMLSAMQRAMPDATIIGADVVRDTLYKLAKEQPSIPLLRFDLLQCPLPSNTFDAVVMLNVLEHIEDDAAALSQVFRILRPGGIVVIEVPAGSHLYDSYDKALQHFRRYHLKELTSKMSIAGFTLERQSHLGFFLYPAFAFVKRRNQRREVSSADTSGIVKQQVATTSSSKLFKLIVGIEKELGKRFSFPAGIRCVAVGRKPA
jgi:SAM-dependent methyltransferase